MWSDLKDFERTVMLAVDIVKANAITISCWTQNKAIAFLNGPFVQSALLSLIVLWSKIQVKVYVCAKHFYDKNELIRVPVDFAIWSYETIEMMNIRHRIEPDCKRLMNICSSARLKRGAYIGKTPFTYFESYNKMNSEVDKEEMVQSFEIAMESNAAVSADNSEFRDEDTIVIMKWDGLYKVTRAESKTRPLNFDFVPSTVRFLSVEYSVPFTKTSVTLKIPNEMLIQGNELFSHAFIRRLLEYQSDPFDFDFRYRLKIMDGNVNEIELNNTQYIVLGEADYEVKEI
jgi:hypothetical protein